MAVGVQGIGFRNQYAPALKAGSTFITKAGEFVYNSTFTRLESSNCPAATTDPILGIACPQGFATYTSFGKVISLLSTVNNAFFQYANTGGASQGQLIASLSSSAGVDPVAGFNYNAGQYGLDPVGGNITVAGPVISLSLVPFTRAAIIKPGPVPGGATRPSVQIDAPEDGTASHMQMFLYGASPDGTVPAQMLVGVVSGSGLLSNVTGSMIETQSSGAATSALSGVQPATFAGSVGIDTRITGDGAARACLTPDYNTAGGGVSAGDGTHAHDVILIRNVAGQWIAHTISAIQPGTTNTPETFHAFTGANSWAQAAGLPTWQYRLNNDGSVSVTGAVSVPVGFTANQAIAAALPTQYRPSISAPSFLGWDVGPAGNTKDLATRFYMTTGGVLTTSPAFPAGVASGDIIAFEDQRYFPGQ